MTVTRVRNLSLFQPKQISQPKRRKQLQLQRRPQLPKRACLAYSRARRTRRRLFRNLLQVVRYQLVSLLLPIGYMLAQELFSISITTYYTCNGKGSTNTSGSRRCLWLQSIPATRSSFLLYVSTAASGIEHVLRGEYSVIAQQPHHLPIVTFATVEEMYRRGMRALSGSAKICLSLLNRYLYTSFVPHSRQRIKDSRARQDL